MDCPPPLGSEDEEEEGEEDFGDFQTVLEINTVVTNNSIKNRIHLDTSESPTRKESSLFEIPPPKHDSPSLGSSSSPPELPPSLPTSPEPSETHFFAFQDTGQKHPADNSFTACFAVPSKGDMFGSLASTTQNSSSMFGTIVEKEGVPENTDMFAECAALQPTEPSDFFSGFENPDENSPVSNSFAASFTKSRDFNDAFDIGSIGKDDEFVLKVPSHIEEAAETIPDTFVSETAKTFESEAIKTFADFPIAMEKQPDSEKIGGKSEKDFDTNTISYNVDTKTPISEEHAFVPDLSFDIDTPSPLKEGLGAKSVFSWDSFEENTVTADNETEDNSLYAETPKNSEAQEEAVQFALFSDDNDQPVNSSDNQFAQFHDTSKLSQPLSSSENEAIRFVHSSIITDEKKAEVGDTIPLEIATESIDDDNDEFSVDSSEKHFTEFKGPKLKHSDNFDSGSDNDCFIQNQYDRESAEKDDIDSKKEYFSPGCESKGEDDNSANVYSGENVFAEFEQDSQVEDDFNDFADFTESSTVQINQDDKAIETGVENDSIDHYGFSNLITDSYKPFTNCQQNFTAQGSDDFTEFSDEHQNKSLESADFSSKPDKEDFEMTAKPEFVDFKITADADNFDDFAEFETTAKAEFADFETTVDADDFDDFADFETTAKADSADFKAKADTDDFDDFADFETTAKADSADFETTVDADDFDDFEATDTQPAAQPAATLETFSGSLTGVQPLKKTISKCFGGDSDDKDAVTPESHANGRLLMCKVNDSDAQFAVATKWLTTPSFSTLVNTLCLSSGNTQPSSKSLQAPAVVHDEFDVFGSVDTMNPPTLLSRDSDELTRDPPQTAPSQKHAAILSAYKTEQAKELSEEAAAIVDSLPDLQFMLSSVLMFPLKTS